MDVCIASTLRDLGSNGWMMVEFYVNGQFVHFLVCGPPNLALTRATTDKLPARYYEKKLAQAQGKVELLASALHGTWNMLSRYSERRVGWSSVYRKWAKGAKDDANVSEFQKCIQGLSDNRDLDNFLLTNADTTFNEISLIEARSLARLLPGGSGHITAPIRAISKGSNTANPVTTSNLYLLGLTLHRAHHLVKFDVDFLDGGDRQILKRIYRIGQKEEGFV